MFLLIKSYSMPVVYAFEMYSTVQSTTNDALMDKELEITFKTI